MKIFTLSLVALTAFVCITPANAQRRNRAAQKQTTEQKKQSDPSASGRREKRQAPKVPLVPCTLTLNEAPSPRGFFFGQLLSQVRSRFAGTQIAITGKNMPISPEKPFIQQYILYSNSAVLGNARSPIEEAANSRYGGSMINRAEVEAQAVRRNEANVTFNNLKEVNLYFYGATDNPILYGYEFLYVPTLAFDSTQAVKELFLNSFKIPVDSWVPVSEDRTRANDWETNCKGWRVAFQTGIDNTGLYFTATNTDIENNLSNIKNGTDKKKTEGFNP